MILILLMSYCSKLATYTSILPDYSTFFIKIFRVQIAHGCVVDGRVVLLTRKW